MSDFNSYIELPEGIYLRIEHPTQSLAHRYQNCHMEPFSDTTLVSVSDCFIYTYIYIYVCAHMYIRMYQTNHIYKGIPIYWTLLLIVESPGISHFLPKTQ